MRKSASPLISGILILLLTCLIFIQRDLLDLTTNFPIQAPWNNAGEFIIWIQAGLAASGSSSLTIFFAMVLLLLVTMVVLQLKYDLLNMFATWVFENNLKCYTFISIVYGALLWYYLMPGPFPGMGDSSAHLMHIWITLDSLEKGFIPTWSNWIYSGTPFLQDYGYLFYFFTAGLCRLFNDFTFGIKMSLFAFHFFSGICFFYAFSSLIKDRRLLFLGGLIYILIGWRAQFVLFYGRWPVAPMFVLMPLITREIIQITLHPISFFQTRWKAFRVAIYFFLMFLNHLMYPILFGMFLALFAVSHIYLTYWDTRDKPALIAGLKTLSFTLILTCLFCSGLVLPYFIEKSRTMLGFYSSSDEGLFLWGKRFTFMSWFIWNSVRFPLFDYPGRQWGDAYYGISVIAIVFWLIYKRFKQGKTTGNPLADSLGIVLLLNILLFISWDLWEKIPFFKKLYLSEAWRYQMPMLFFLSLFVAVSFSFKTGLISRNFIPLAILAVLVDLGSLTLIHTPYGEIRDWDKHAQMTQAFEGVYQDNNRQIPNHRAYYEGVSDYDFTNKGGPMTVMRARFPSFLGGTWQGAALSYRYLRTIYPLLEENIQGKPEINLNQRILNLFFLTNTRLLILNGQRRVLQGDQNGLWVPNHIGNDKTLLWMNFCPIINSNKVAFLDTAGLDDQGYCLAVLNGYRIQPQSGMAENILLSDREQASRCPDLPIARVAVRSLENDCKNVRITLSASSPAYVRLPYSFHEAIKVNINGEKAVLMPAVPPQT